MFGIKMPRRTTRICRLKTPLIFCFIISISFFIIQIMSLVKLTTSGSKQSTKTTFSKIGKFGKSLITMLPEDLKFTMFLPSENAINLDLRLKQNDSNSHAALTRVLGFSAVPRWICSGDLDYEREMIYDSISGYKLYVSKDLNGMVVVNGVVAEDVDLKLGNLLIHVMNGVVMDSEFEESMQPDEEN